MNILEFFNCVFLRYISALARRSLNSTNNIHSSLHKFDFFFFFLCLITILRTTFKWKSGFNSETIKNYFKTAMWIFLRITRIILISICILEGNWNFLPLLIYFQFVLYSLEIPPLDLREEFSESVEYGFN